MAVHKLNNTDSWKEREADRQKRLLLQRYPGAVRAKIDQLIYILNKTKNLQGDTKVEFTILGCKWETNLSHYGITTLRKKGYKIKCVGGYGLSMDSINSMFQKYSTPDAIREKL